MVKSRSVIVGSTPSGNHHADVHTIADLKAGQVDVDLVWNVVDAAEELNGITHHVQNAATAQTWAVIFIDEVTRHFNGKFGIRGYTEKVNMLRPVSHRMKLYVTRQDTFVLAADVERVHRRKQIPRGHLALQVAGLDGNLQGRLPP